MSECPYCATGKTVVAGSLYCPVHHITWGVQTDKLETRIAALELEQARLRDRVDYSQAHEQYAPPAASDERCAFTFEGYACDALKGRHEADPKDFGHPFTPAPSPPATGEKNWLCMNPNHAATCSGVFVNCIAPRSAAPKLSDSLKLDGPKLDAFLKAAPKEARRWQVHHHQSGFGEWIHSIEPETICNLDHWTGSLVVVELTPEIARVLKRTE